MSHLNKTIHQNGVSVVTDISTKSHSGFAPEDLELEVDILPLILGRNRANTFLKRMFDISLAIIGIIVYMPLMAIIAVAIKLESRGPILFKQTRVGQNRRRHHDHMNFRDRRNGHDLKGRPINIYKFRTMLTNADPYAVSPHTKDDSRITRVGRFLRSSCMDELPQFFSVLSGDLSMVGPRPEMPFIVDSYGPRESLRLLVKPGVTGLWQLKGSRTRLIHEDLSHDLEYIVNQSIWLDMKIIFWTLVFIFKQKNA